MISKNFNNLLKDIKKNRISYLIFSFFIILYILLIFAILIIVIIPSKRFGQLEPFDASIRILRIISENIIKYLLYIGFIIAVNYILDKIYSIVYKIPDKNILIKSILFTYVICIPLYIYFRLMVLYLSALPLMPEGLNGYV